MNRNIYLMVFFNMVAGLFYMEVAAQDAPISSLPMEYNGGFAGEAGTPRLASFSRFRTIHYPGVRYAQYVAYDNFFKKIGSGVGFTVGHTSARGRAVGNFENTSAMLAISPKFSFQGNRTFAPFVDFTFINSSYSASGGSPYPANSLMDHNYLGLFRTGFLYNWRSAYFGMSAALVKFDKANESLYRFHRNISLQPAFDFQAGYTFQRRPDSKFSITPQVAIRVQREYGVDFQDISVSLRYKKCLIGLNQAGFMLGWQNDQFRVQLSQNFSRSSMGYFDPVRGEMIYSRSFGYQAAVSLRYIFAEGKQSPAR